MQWLMWLRLRIRMRRFVVVALPWLLLQLSATTTRTAAAAWSSAPPPRSTKTLKEMNSRRDALLTLLISSTTSPAAADAWMAGPPIDATTTTTTTTPVMSLVQSPPSPRSLPPLDSSLAARLAARDPSQLTNRVFNLATPAVQVYPEWLRGDWIVTSTFAGFVFPSTRIPKDRLTAANNAANIPGFQKCSIIAAHTADIGGPSVRRPWSVDVATGWEDRAFNLQQSASASLGYPAVRTVTYNPRRNPNRISMDFTDYRTVNAERIELFCNARESSNAIATSTNIQNGTTDAPPPTFVCAEYLRQVTFGTGSTVGVPRQAVTNYANFWTYQPNTVVCDTTDKKDEKTSSRSSSIINQWTGNVLTAAYLDPQDPMYFDEPSQPVVVYSHSLSATRR